MAELKAMGLPSPELDAEILLEFVTKKDRSFILCHPEYKLPARLSKKYEDLIRDRQKGEPVAYLTGRKEFFGYEFFVNENVLIPRPESEWLVEEALKVIKYYILNMQPNLSNFSVYFKEENAPALRYFRNRLKKSVASNYKYTILDMGTGSGCLIISLIKKIEELYFKKLTDFTFFASDINSRALGIAKKNAKKYNAFNDIKFYKSDLFSNPYLHKKYDLILANLPYVPEDRKQSIESIKYEPKEAIFADDNGSAIIKKFLSQSVNFLKNNGVILIELDPRNAFDLQKHAKKIYPEAKIELSKDLAGFERYLRIENVE
jgi:release factor glutamine methyltransferase